MKLRNLKIEEQKLITQNDFVEKRAKCKRLFDDTQAIRTKAIDENREVTGAEREKMEHMLEDAINLKSDADSLQKEWELQEMFSNQTPVINHSRVSKKSDTKNENKEAFNEMTSKAMDTYIRKGETAMRSYLDADTLKAMNTVVDNQGGYLANDVQEKMILTALYKRTPLLSYCNISTISGRSINYPTFDQDLDLEKTPQGTAFTEVNVTGLGSRTWTPYKMGAIIKINREMIEDSEQNIESFVYDQFALSWNKKYEKLVLYGNGVQEPLGLISSSLNIVDIAGSTDAIVPSDLIETAYDLDPAYRDNAVWIMPKLTAKKIAKAVATTYSPNFLMGFSKMTLGDILGRPVVETWNFPDPSANGHAMAFLADMSRYFIRTNRGFTIKRLEETYGATDQIGIAISIRLDGALYDINSAVRLDRK